MKSFWALVLIIVVSIAVMVALQFLFPTLPVSTLGMLLALASIATLAIKFGLADLFSTSGFNDEKTAVDLALTLCSTLFAMAMIQHSNASHVVFPAIILLADGPQANPTAGRAELLMWLAFGLSALLFLASAIVLLKLQEMRASTNTVRRPKVRLGLMALMRLFTLSSFVVSYTLYLITILFKA